MYDRYERNQSLVSWMIAGGARLDEPDARHIEHVVALRRTQGESTRAMSPLAWLAARFAPQPPASATARGGTAAATCCAPA